MKRNKRIFVWVITIDVFSESERPQIPGLHTIFEMTYSSLIFVIFALILNLRTLLKLVFGICYDNLKINDSVLLFYPMR